MLPLFSNALARLSSLNRHHMFETKRWQKLARRPHASSCCSNFTTSSATSVTDTCQFRLENCPRSLRSSFPGVDRVRASLVGRSRRRCGKPPRMPLGFTGQGAYTSSAGPRGGSTFWAHSGISDDPRRGRGQAVGPCQSSVLFHPWQRPGMDRSNRRGAAAQASATSIVRAARVPCGEVVGPWPRNQEL